MRALPALRAQSRIMSAKSSLRGDAASLPFQPKDKGRPRTEGQPRRRNERYPMKYQPSYTTPTTTPRSVEHRTPAGQCLEDKGHGARRLSSTVTAPRGLDGGYTSMCEERENWRSAMIAIVDFTPASALSGQGNLDNRLFGRDYHNNVVVAFVWPDVP